jgi:hypothetical protein
MSELPTTLIDKDLDMVPLGISMTPTYLASIHKPPTPTKYNKLTEKALQELVESAMLAQTAIDVSRTSPHLTEAPQLPKPETGSQGTVRPNQLSQKFHCQTQ